MTAVDKANLPDPDQGVEALLALSDVLGDEYVFKLYRAVNLNRPGPTGLSPAAEAQSTIAQRMLARLREEDTTLDYETARRRLADKLGYTATARTNFYKLLEGKPRPYKTAGGKA